jgi:hypothetical protein
MPQPERDHVAQALRQTLPDFLLVSSKSALLQNSLQIAKTLKI